MTAEDLVNYSPKSAAQAGTVGEVFQYELESPVSLAPLTAEISLASCRLPEFHGDPADRLIAATAITHGLTLVTSDEKLLARSDLKTLSTR